MLPTERFSSRVENYIKYRPHYPNEVLTALEQRTGLLPKHVIADVGSGTGFSAELFLQNGNTVYGIEPNEAMRKAGEHYLKTFKNFRSVNGTAEATTLRDRSVDYIVAGQAFHWFEPDAARTEFRRILRDPRWVVLLWNDRQTDTTPFLRDYEALLQEFGTDYNEINHRNIDSAKVREFFQHDQIQELQIPYVQRFEYEGVKGRLVSSSYVPSPGDAQYEPMIERLRELWEKYGKENGTVDMLYTTLVYVGRL